MRRRQVLPDSARQPRGPAVPARLRVARGPRARSRLLLAGLGGASAVSASAAAAAARSGAGRPSRAAGGPRAPAGNRAARGRRAHRTRPGRGTRRSARSGPFRRAHLSTASIEADRTEQVKPSSSTAEPSRCSVTSSTTRSARPGLVARDDELLEALDRASTQSGSSGRARTARTILLACVGSERSSTLNSSSLKLLARARADDLDRDVALGLVSREPDHVARQVHDPHRLAHLEHEHLSRARRRGRRPGSRAGPTPGSS